MFNVLIVDNDRPMCCALNKMLQQQEDFQLIESVHCPEKAMELCNHNKVDVIFMNMWLSGISGIEASEKIAKKHPDTCIYLMTSYMQTHQIKAYCKESISGCIEKPFTYEQVQNILGEYKIQKDVDGQKQIEALISLLQNKDYGQMYYGIGNIVREVYNSRGKDQEAIYKTMKKIGESLFSTMSYYDMEHNHLEYIFPLNDVLIGEPSITELWLFKVMDFIFQQNAINRYPLLEQIFTYINDHVKEDITLNTLVETCNISQGYLSRIIKNQFNTSVMEYLHMRKMSLAKGYFCFTQYSISEIAFKLGYNESSYFSKVFKKYEHMTGKQYRNVVRPMQ